MLYFLRKLGVWSIIIISHFLAICDYLNKEMVKRICSLLTLMVLMLTQCFTSINYVLAENNAEQDFLVEENINQEEEVSDDTEKEEEKADSLPDIQNEEENVQSDDEQEDSLADVLETQEYIQDNEQEEDTTSDIQDVENVEWGEDTEDTSLDIQNDNDEVEENMQGSWVNILESQEDVQEEIQGEQPTQQTTEEPTTPEIQEENNEEKWVIDTITEEINEIITKIRYFFKKEWDSRYIKYGKDGNNIGTITLKDPKSWESITIMDKNLWAESVWVGKSSYGYYFQWWNNHGVKTVTSSNKTTQKAIYKDSYYNRGYDGQWLFIVWSTDYWDNGDHYNSLWWNESKESSRYGACPVGYHIPTMEEWNELLEIWWRIHTQDISNNEPLLRYSAHYSARGIHTLKDALTLCGQWDIECVEEDKLPTIIEILSSELKLPLAWSYDENGNYHDWIWVYWTTMSKNGNIAWVFDVDAYVCKWLDERLMYKSQWHNIRCFQNVQPYEAPAQQEENSEEGQVQDQQENNQQENTQNTYSVNNIPSKYVTYSLVLDTTKELINLELKANGWKFENEEETKTLKYGYYNQEATIDVEALKQDEYRSWYEVEEWAEKQLTIQAWYELMDEIETPTREWYIFDGWYTQIETGEKVDVEKVDIDNKSITENMQLYAHWIAKEYTITWKNEDWTIRDITKVLYGQMPTHEDIYQPADEKYTYTFAWWEPEIRVVDWDTEYRAKYKYILRNYTVTWKDEEGNTLKTEQVAYGTMPTYDGEIPKKIDWVYEYSFNGWEPEISEVIWDVVYVAKYDIVGPLISENDDFSDDVLEPVDSVDDIQDYGDMLCWKEWDGSENIEEVDEVIDIQDSVNSGDNLEWEENQWFFEELWETLKSFFLEDEDGYLRWSETINDIVVSVEAEAWTFPEWTEVVIKWVSDERLESIQTSLVEDETNDVTEDAQILAFDISFIYSWEEIQPEKEVSVKFNYKENIDFQWSSMSELSVYHIDDETDEWEEVEVVNKEWDEIEILATSFSTYAVVAQKWLRNTPVSWRGISDQMPDFIFNGITIYRPDSLSWIYQDSPAVYVVMDRNLWATSPWTICDTWANIGTCGLLYQFWNNYWFSYGNIDFLQKYTGASVDLTLYSPSNPYYDSRFIRWYTNCDGSCDIRDWAVVPNPGIWWGKDGDYFDRQWPCPDWWYIPNKQEWQEVVDYWTVWESNQWTWVLNSSNINAFRNYFQLPLGWERTRTDGILSQVWVQWSYFTTEPNGWNPYILRITTSNWVVNSHTNYNQVNWYSIRCFKNVNAETYYLVTYNDGVEWEEIFPDQTGSVIFGSNYPEFSWSLEREGYQFLWWTESIWSDVIFDTENNRVIQDVTLYAKWKLVCPDGEDEWPDGQCHTEAELQRLNQIVVDLDLYYLVSDGSTDNKQYTIMDRNMWATFIYNKNYTSPNNDSKWYFYQWWNNYGFPSTWWTNLPGSVATTTSQVPKSIWGEYIPSRYASGVYYYNNTSHGNWMAGSTSSDGIWWWTWDTYLVNGIGTTLEWRQWPCPAWYHVPSSVEWQNLFDLYPWDETASDLENFTKDLLIPSVWRRAENGKLANTKALSYWSSSPSSDINRAMGFYWEKDKVIERYQSDWRARARSVRCFKNTWSEFVSKENIHLNGWTDVFISIHSWTILSLWIPTLTSAQLAQATFDGWYTTSDFSWNALSTWDTISKWSSLYAKFTCNESWYVWNGSGCEDWVRLYFDSMWWTEVPSQLIESGMTWTRPADPTKTWYVFSGWFLTWAVEEFDFTWTVITGETTVYAHWTPSTGIQYIVYHYAKRVWENTYALTDTDILSWTTDQVLTLSSLAKESEFMCAHYSSWSLTWTESWPWAIVTQTTIRWDGSTKIYLYYTRNSHTVYLSGDANVDHFEIDGQERSEAVRECWSEVPVEAVPKTWYHFVRWDREESRRRKNDEIPWE